ncbi:MAG: CoA pyrophosphatase [Baekduia sp.]
MSVTPQPADLLGRLEQVLLDPVETSGRRVRGKAAAVLVAMTDLGGDDAQVVLTRRRDDLRRHAGEISFPGGRRDPGDETLLATALREANEETGLEPAAVRVAGALEPMSTIATGYAVYPFVGVIEPGLPLSPHEAEVAEIVELPLSRLAEVYEHRSMRRRGISFKTHAFPVTDEIFVWGLTGRILHDLLGRLGLR